MHSGPDGDAFRQANFLLVFLVLAMPVLDAQAQKAGDNVVSIGWLNLDPHSSSGPLTVTEAAGQPANNPFPGTALRVESAGTVAFTVEHYLTDQIGLQAALGWPPTHKISGEGTLSSAGVIGQGEQWGPAITVRYHFGRPESRLRPYLGLGVSRTWFKQTKITNAAFRETTYGPNATTQVSAHPAWSPVYSIGFDYKLTERWTAGFTLSHIPLRTTVVVAADNTSAGYPFKVSSDLKLRTVASFINIGYRF